jgi:signal transduction histidine kinase
MEPVRTARTLAQSLLAEMRAVVGNDLSHQIIDLRQALQTLCAGIPSPRIVLSFDAQLDTISPALSHTVFRVVQEAVSNAVRHSGASMLEIGVSRRREDLAISIGDNGNGMSRSAAASGGNGLRGMRERVEEVGGTLETINRVEGGLSINIRLPLAGDGR